VASAAFCGVCFSSCTTKSIHIHVFNVRQSYCAAHVLDIGWTSVRLSVRPSHAGIVETAQPIIKLSSLPGSPMILCPLYGCVLSMAVFSLWLCSLYGCVLSMAMPSLPYKTDWICRNFSGALGEGWEVQTPEPEPSSTAVTN